MIEVAGFTPTRTHHKRADGTVVVQVKAPKFMGTPAREVILNQDQFLRYMKWRNGDGMIQEYLPDLTATQREILMAGIE